MRDGVTEENREKLKAVVGMQASAIGKLEERIALSEK